MSEKEQNLVRKNVTDNNQAEEKRCGLGSCEEDQRGNAGCDFDHNKKCRLSCLTDSVSICGRDVNGKIRKVRTDAAGRLAVTASNLDIRDLSCVQDSVTVCGKGVDCQNHKLQTDAQGSVGTVPKDAAYSQIGRLFSYAGLIAFDTVQNHRILLENPAANNRVLYLDTIVCGMVVSPLNEPVSNAGTLAIEIEGDVIPEGEKEPVNPRNLNLGFPGNSTMALSIIPNYTPGLRLLFTRIMNEMVTLDLQGRIIVPPGHNVVVDFLTNATPGFVVGIEFTITYYEI